MIDWDRVQTLREEIGADDFEEVVPLFMAEVTGVTEQLRKQPQPERLAADLHFLKGSALNLGFAEFSALCQDGEQRAAAGQADTVDVTAILDCFDRSRALFEKGLTQGRAA